ncbi:MAG: DUF72 domain-containing protein, partial [Pseudomonadota bacterium]
IAPTMQFGIGVRKLISRIKNEEDKGSSDLKVYAQSFNGIELNSSYYSTPSSAQIASWKSEVPEGFRFFPKAPKAVTFRASASLPRVEWDHYLRSLEDFGSHLGDSFLQFSPHMTTDHKIYLFQILKALPSRYRFHIELRHPSWFVDLTMWDKLCDYLHKKSVGLVITDTPGRRDVLHMCVTSPHLFVRFKGNNAHDSDFKRIDDWIHMTSKVPSLSSLAFFHHHSEESHCADTIAYMRKQLVSVSSNALPEIRWKANPQMGLF